MHIKQSNTKKELTKDPKTYKNGCFHIAMIIAIDLIITVLIITLLEWLMITYTPFNSSQKIIFAFIIFFGVAIINGKILEYFYIK